MKKWCASSPRFLRSIVPRGEEMKIGALIFSRHDSLRLPGKALRGIAGRELLGRVLDRAATLSNVEQVVVATSTREIDDAIVQYAHAAGYESFRGDAQNVALRAVHACERFGWDGFVRICGDRPFFNPAMIDRAVTMFTQGGYDLVTTSGAHLLPPGLTVEVVRCGALKAHLHAFSDANKEHLTSFFYEHPDPFTIGYVDYPALAKARFNTRLVVDDATDLARAEWIAARMDSLGRAAYSDSERILGLACEWDANLLASADKSGK